MPSSVARRNNYQVNVYMAQGCAGLSGNGMIFTGKAWISDRMARAWWRQKNSAPSMAVTPGWPANTRT